MITIAAIAISGFEHATEPGGVNAFRQRALRHDIDLQLTGDHLSLRLGFGADLRDDHTRSTLCTDQLADAATGPCRCRS